MIETLALRIFLSIVERVLRLPCRGSRFPDRRGPVSPFHCLVSECVFAAGASGGATFDESRAPDQC